MTEMSCHEFQDVAAELALGVLTGRERAQAIAHLDHCEACRESVRQLTLTGEGLLGLVPGQEPPAGFETRVLERIGLPTPDTAPQTGPERRRPASTRPPAGRPGPSRPGPARPGRRLSRTQRLLTAAAVVVAVIAGGLGGWALHNGTSPSAPPAALDSARLVSAASAGHQPVGQIFVYRGRPRWVYMSVSLPGRNSTVICQVEGRSGHFTPIGSFRLTDGYGYWGSPAPGSAGSLTGARLVTPDGTVLATATF
jgi:hypothetical protein